MKMKNITIFKGFTIKALCVSILEVAPVRSMKHSFLVVINNSLVPFSTPKFFTSEYSFVVSVNQIGQIDFLTPMPLLHI